MGNDKRATSGLANVTIAGGGDHQFDLPHLRREGAVRLLQRLLQAAGYHQRMPWHVRVEKKIHCNGETRPVTVVGAKPWCCYVKIKPGDNNTAHYCSLLMPDGFRGEAVYQALKNAEDRVNLAWRSGLDGEAPMNDASSLGTNGVSGDGDAVACADAGPSAPPEAPRVLFEPPPAAGLPEPPPVDLVPGDGGLDPGASTASELPEPSPAGLVSGDEAVPSELLGWIQDKDKVRLTLLAIHDLGREGLANDIDRFVAALVERLGWHGLRRKQVGGVFTGFVRRGYIVRLRQGSQALGYALTDLGRELIQDLVSRDEPRPPQPQDRPLPEREPIERAPRTSPALEPAHLATRLTGIAQDYANAFETWKANRARRAELLAELECLDAEAIELDRLVNNPEVQALLARLLQLTEGGASGRREEGHAGSLSHGGAPGRQV